MNVGFVLSTRGDVTGGLETIADHLASGLAARGHRVTLLGGFTSTATRRDDVRQGVEPLWHRVVPWTSPILRGAARLTATAPLNLQSTTLFASAMASRRTRRRLATFDVTVSFLEGEAVLFSRYQARHGRASIYYCSGGFDHRWAKRDQSTVRVAISATVADHLSRLGYQCDGVVTPGITPELLDRPAAAGREERGIRLLTVGRLGAVKGIHRLLAVVSALAPNFPGLTLHIVGEGAERRALEAAIRERHLEASVILRGALSESAVADALSEADLFLFPSSYESFGIVAIEAMAAGVPVVASDLPALREATGGLADLLPADDEAQWIAAVDVLLRDRARREDMSRNGRLWASHFAWDRVVADFETHVENAVQRFHRRLGEPVTTDPNEREQDDMGKQPID